MSKKEHTDIYNYSTNNGSLKEKKQKLCIVCGNKTVFKNFCIKCKRMIPSGYNKKRPIEVIAEEIRRNKERKNEFKETTRTGTLSFDTEKNIFHIDNAYYYVSELEGFSFYSSNPRPSTNMFNRRIYVSDVYFSYTPIGEQRRIRKIVGGVNCRYEVTGTNVLIEPPACMILARQQFMDMINNEQAYLMRQIEIMKKNDSGN